MALTLQTLSQTPLHASPLVDERDVAHAVGRLVPDFVMDMATMSSALRVVASGLGAYTEATCSRMLAMSIIRRSEPAFSMVSCRLIDRGE